MKPSLEISRPGGRRLLHIGIPFSEREVRIPVADAVLVTALLLVASATWGYAALATVSAAPSVDGPTRDVTDLPSGLQEVLQQAPAPKHDRPTTWGLLLINPVVNGEAVLNSQELPLPRLDSADVRRGKEDGTGAYEKLAAVGLPTIDIPQQYRKGMSVGRVESISDGSQFWTVANFSSGTGTEDVMSLQVEAYTPSAPVPVEEFPDNAIRLVRETTDVGGNPTITMFPTDGTSNPRNERMVAWSQGDRVYFLRTTGLYPNTELLALANHISKAEGSR